MYIARPYERNDLYNTPMNTLFQHVGKLQNWSMTPRQLPLLLFILGLCSHQVRATPIQETSVEKRDSQADSQSLSPKIWVPVVVAIIVLFCLAIMTWTKKSFPRSLRLFNMSGAASVSPLGGATAGPRVLTAEQLAGTINGETQTPAAAAAAPRTTARRTRRPRRTPSQMSVTSLPEYNKEPGEEELVIFRGRDMEDATMPAAVVTRMSADDESSMSHDHSQVSRYSPMPTSPHNMPLLQPEDTFDGDLSIQSLQAPVEEPPRRSFDAGSHEASSLMRIDSNNSAHSSELDPRGEAPAYFEVVDQSTIDLNQQATTSPSTSPEPTPASVSRRSGFRTLLNRMSIVANPHGHNRNESSGSAFSSTRLEPTTSRASHRTNPSGSSSMLSSSMFRTISRQKSTHTLNSARLNSPSMISLNSISAPLTHTATRTEFTYPKSGPTAEQLKVISSRETFTRFGVPYGADAIAFASSSRLDLLPPPDFETAASERPSSPGHSRLRSMSNVALTAAPSRLAETPESSDSVNDQPSAQAEASSQPPAAIPKNEEDKSSPTVTVTSHADTSSSISKNHSSISRPASLIAQQEQQSSTSSRSTSSPPSSAKPTVNEFGKLSAPPPSAYHDQTGSSARSESRASIYSNQTFATAAESMSPSVHMRTPTDSEFLGDDDQDIGTAPSTPRVGGQHALEATDATVKPSRDIGNSGSTSA